MSQENSSPIFHAASVEEVTSFFSVDTQQGLSVNDRHQRQIIYGPNLLPKSEGGGSLYLFWRQFKNPLVYVLMGSTSLALVMGKFVDAGVVFGVVVVNAIIGFIQEFKASKALESLSQMISDKANVLIAGKLEEIESSQLIPGDVVLLKSGDRVSADCRLVEVKSLKIEESALTGESMAVEKNVHAVPLETSLGNKTCMAFSGTLVTYGTAKAIVVAIGAGTELGKISKLLNSAISTETPLTQSLARFGRWVTLAISIVAIVLMFIGYIRGFDLSDSFLAAITLAVAAIPEGLPAIVTITLAIGVRRMADRQAVIRKLPAVETLGSASVICSDKTGTLTKNEMTVQGIWTTQGAYRLTGTGYQREGQILSDGVPVAQVPKTVWSLLKAGVLCNDSRLQRSDLGFEISGDPTEVALLVSFEKLGGDKVALDLEHNRLDTVPFESDLQYMATLNREEESQIIFLKGAPEIVFSKCLDLMVVEKARYMMNQFAGQGMRVLAFARKYTEKKFLSPEQLNDGFELLGLQAMIDPPREQVIGAIRDCHNAGIKVKMITGDHKMTAQAIARQIGVDNGADVISGEELEKFSDNELIEVVSRSNVFARVTPEQKLRLVKALQAAGAIVSMTGDGVNDAPALKQANIGVAMGITGTSVSKEAADLILMDDNFFSIKAAVEEGRRIYDNLVKSLAFILPTNLGEALIILVAVSFFPMVGGQVLMPILPVQILWINLVSTIALALPLAFESPEADIMKRPPRDPKEPILNSFVFIRTVLVAILMAAGAIGLFLFEYQSSRGFGITHELALHEAQTMAVTTVIFFQIFYLFNCRSIKSSIFSVGFFSNKIVFAGVALILLLQAVFVHWEVMQNLFQSSDLSFYAWLKSALVGAIVLPAVAIEKWYRARL